MSRYFKPRATSNELKATSLKIYRERHGLPAMWKELACMLKVNEYDRKQGEKKPTFSDEAIAELEARINIAELRAQEGDAWFDKYPNGEC